MKNLKLFEAFYTDSEEAKYVQDFLIHVGMVIQKLSKDMSDPDDGTGTSKGFGFKMGSTKVTMYVKGQFFHGKNVIVCELREFGDKWYVMWEHANEFFDEIIHDEPKIVRYINLKIDSLFGSRISGIAPEKLEELSKVTFNYDEADEYIEAEKYNL